MTRGLPFGQLFLAVLLGVAGGVYIYKPMFQQYFYDRKALESDITTAEAATKEKE